MNKLLYQALMPLLISCSGLLSLCATDCCLEVLCVEEKMTTNQIVLQTIKDRLTLIKKQIPKIETLHSEFETIIEKYESCTQNVVTDLVVQAEDNQACRQACETLEKENSHLATTNACLGKENHLLKTIQDLLQQHNELLQEKASNLNCEYQTNLEKINTAILQLKEHFNENRSDQQNFVEYIKNLLEKNQEDAYEFISKLHNLCMFEILD